MLEIHSKRRLTCLPTDNPCMLENWRLTDTEWTASTPDLAVIGEIPKDLNGVYLTTYLTNLNSGKGECAIFDARDITPVPICRIILPGHIPMGAHACWAPQSALQGGAGA